MSDSQPPSSSLQKTIEAFPAPETPYFRRRVEYMLDQTQKYEKLELTAATIFMIIVAISQGTGEGVLAALIAFLFVLYGISLVHFLRAPRALDERYQSQLAKARSLLGEAKGKVERPDIECEIKDIHEDSSTAGAGFAYIFTMNLYLKNKGKVIGVRGYRLRMIQGEHEYPAEKTSLQGYYLETKEPHPIGRYGELELKNISHPMPDLEDMKNLPLDHVGRDGWLRFVVREVAWNDEYEEGLGDDETVEALKKKRLPKKLELTVIDSDGAEYIFEKPQPWTAEGRIRRYANAR